MTNFSDKSDEGLPYAELSLELSEREIYNDIRSEIDVTESHTRVDDPEYGEGEARSGRLTIWPYDPLEITLTSPVPVTRWGSPYAYNVFGNASAAWCGNDSDFCEIRMGGRWKDTWCSGITRTHIVTVMIRARREKEIDLRVASTVDGWTDCNVAVPYQYLIRAEQIHTRSWVRTLRIRRTDADSISKYGRRVMNLVWPLGQSREEMTAIIESYLARHKEPMPLLHMKLKGDRDTLIEEILQAEVSDRHRIWNEDLGITGESFFVNSVDFEQEAGRFLTGNWTLEQARPEEELYYFRLGVSAFEDEHVLA